MYMWVCERVCKQRSVCCAHTVCVYVYFCVCAYVFMCTYRYDVYYRYITWMYMNVYVYKYTCVYVCVCESVQATLGLLREHCAYLCTKYSLFYRALLQKKPTILRSLLIVHIICITHMIYTISKLLKIVGLFCKRALQKRRYFAKETDHFKEPTSCSHPIVHNTSSTER